MDITTGTAVAKTAVDLVKNENVLNKSVGVMGMLFPFAGLKQKAVEIYIKDIEKSDLPAETKVFMIMNTKKTFKKIKNQKTIAEIAMENAKQGQGQVKLPYQLTEKDFALANELSPMEQAERNKEYALYTISILAKIYTDEVEKQTGNIVPLTDLPGSAAIVDALRFNPNSGVKIAAIDALRHIQRPEYKEELTTLYTLAQADSNPQVSMAAERALNRSNV